MKNFCRHREIILLAVFFTFLLIQRIDGYPHPWTFMSSQAVKQPLTEESSHYISVSEPEADILIEATTTSAEITTFHNLKPSLSAYVQNRDVSRILDKSNKKQTITLEDINTDEDPDKAEDEKLNKEKHNEDENIHTEIDNQDKGLDMKKDDEDKEIDKDIDKENKKLDNEKNEQLHNESDDDKKNNAIKYQSNVNLYDTNRTEYNDDDISIEEPLKNKIFITPKESDSYMGNDGNKDPEDIDDDGLIFEAINESIFLTPEEFETLQKNNGEDKTATTDMKTYENRAPRNPTAEVNGTNLNTNDGLFDMALTTYLDNFARLPVPSCNGSTYCESLPYYPSDELVENALRINYIEPISDPSSIAQRMGNPDPDESREESLCFSEKKEIKPGSGLDENQEWHYIINNAKYQQKIEIELCSEEGDSCRLIDPPAVGYKTFCKQKYVYRHLATITPNGTTASKSILMPSSCCCHVKFSTNIASRMGGEPQGNNQRGPKLNLLPRQEN